MLERAAACLADSAFGLTRIEVYQATAPVSDRSEAAQTAAFKAALKIVLIRVTARRTADEEAVFAPLVNNARAAMFSQYRSAPDDQFVGGVRRFWPSNAGLLRMANRYGAAIGLRPSFGLSVQAGAQAVKVLTADDTSELKGPSMPPPPCAVFPDMAERGGRRRGDRCHGPFRRPISGIAWALRACSSGAQTMSRRLPACAGRCFFQDRSSEFSGAVEGVNRAADLYAGLFAASGSLAPVDIEVGGVADLRDYANVQGYLESLTFITHVSVAGLERRHGEISLDHAWRHRVLCSTRLP